MGSPDRAGRGLVYAILIHPIPRGLFSCIFEYVWTQPPKNAFCRPQQTRTTSTDGPLTLQAGPRYPRGRACPVGWPSAAPVPVDAGHPVLGGSCRRALLLPPCGDTAIQAWFLRAAATAQSHTRSRVMLLEIPQNIVILTGRYGSPNPHTAPE